uniref:Uncharacterized protein n=1 Tax=Mola mola TaxID=94237 RepID=A0A3Q3W857_MOLML
MYAPPYYDNPPPYNPTFQAFSPPASVHCPQSQDVPDGYSVPPDSCNVEGRPQHFFRCFSPPGFIKTFQGATVLMCFIIFACVVSTLVWDVYGVEYGSYGYMGKYDSSSSYMTPQSAKAAMISMAVINFLVSLGFLVGTLSRSQFTQGCRFYFTVFASDIILAILQAIIDIVYVIGVNPMAQSSQSLLYNPMLMCQNIQGSPSLSSSLGAGFPGGFPTYNQYLYHYCYMDPQEVVALVLGLMVVLTLSLSAYYAYKTRSKIWRHSKDNIYWVDPLVRQSQEQGAQDWVSNEVMNGSRCSNLISVSSFSADSSSRRGAESHNNGVTVYSSSSPSEENPSFRKSPSCHKKKRKKVPEPGPAAQEMEFQYETGYTTGDTGNELVLYPEIISDEQRRQYKMEFDCELARYKTLCAKMDQISDQMHKLSQELDALDKDSMKYQGVVDEYNRLKDLKRRPDYQAKKKQCKELRRKLIHIKQLVKTYDQGLC